MTTGSLSAIMQRFDFVRETQGPNAGLWVNMFQRFTGNTDRDSWCCSFLCFCLDVLTRGHSPYRKSGVCQDIYRQARLAGEVVSTPQVNDIFVLVDDNDHAHHIGAVTGVEPLTGIAGNTSEDGVSSNGDGVHEHELKVQPQHIRFIRPTTL